MVIDPAYEGSEDLQARQFVVDQVLCFTIFNLSSVQNLKTCPLIIGKLVIKLVVCMSHVLLASQKFHVGTTRQQSLLAETL